MIDAVPKAEKPVAKRTDGGFELNEAAVSLVTAIATKNHESPVAVLRELVKGKPANRLLLKLLGVRMPEVKNGRPFDDERLRAIFFTVNELHKKVGRTRSYKEAPAVLRKQGITGPRGAELTENAVRRVCRTADRARLWFDDSLVPRRED